MATKSVTPDIVKRSLHFLDVDEEKNQSLPPIHGYENKPLVSLKAAVEPVEALVSDIQVMVTSVKKGTGASIENLSIDQSASILLYTLEWEPRENSFFYILNQTLRSEDRDKLKPWFLYLKLILTALEHLPSISCVVYRGVKLDLSSKYPEGTIFTWWGFSSCTSSPNVLETDQFLGTKGKRTVFVINCKSGKDIRKLSYYQYEFEVLLLPATQFRVIKCRKSRDLITIEIEEIQSAQKTGAAAFPTRSIPADEGYSNPSLEKLIHRQEPRSQISLHHKVLKDEDMWIVVEQALNRKQCTELYLSNNRGITVHGISIIALALDVNKTLVSLNLGTNPQISDDSVEILARSLKTNRTLKVLDLSQNSIQSGGAEYLAEMLKVNETLIDLDLNNNQIRNEGIQYLATALAKSNKTLDRLSIDWNPFADGCINSLIDMLKNNRTLTRLEALNSNTLSMEGKVRLKEVGKERLQ